MYPEEFREDMEILKARTIHIRPMIQDQTPVFSFSYYVQLGLLGGFAFIGAMIIIAGLK